jgi:hypothetical protein
MVRQPRIFFAVPSQYLLFLPLKGAEYIILLTLLFKNSLDDKEFLIVPYADTVDTVKKTFSSDR